VTLDGAPNSQHLTQRQLESALWAAANALRGPVDPGDFKAYVFPILFFKWISDNWDYRHAEAVADWGDQLTEEIEESDYQPFRIPKKCHWADVHGTAVNLGAKVQLALGRIEEALSASMAKSDGQLAYYVAQAREVIDLSIMSQKQVIEDLQGLAGRTAPMAGGA